VDVSIKDNIATLISYTHRSQEIIAKTTHYATNVNSTEAELFSIRYKINHTVYLSDVNYIIVITNAIFDMLIHLYQLHFITILKDLKKFFNKNSNNIIEFWYYLNSIK